MAEIHASSTTANILVVDDAPTNLLLLARVLNSGGYNVRTAEDGESALAQIASNPPDLILLDIMMPDMDGYQVCTQLKENAQTSEIPVIFISALIDVFDKMKAFSVGAVDYITKPFEPMEVLARVNMHLSLRKLQIELKEKNSLLEAKNIQLEEEIQKRKLAEEKQRQLAITDPLTKLFNRRHFFEVANRELARAIRNQNPLSVVLMDLDHFKSINDTFGHLAGDQVLQTMAKLCQDVIRVYDILARYGGEEFIFLFPRMDSAVAKLAAERLRRKICAKPVCIGEQQIKITSSLGVATLDLAMPTTLDHLLDRADHALYQAKENGRNQVAVA